MESSLTQKLQEFHWTATQIPGGVSTKSVSFRFQLIYEEFKELADALNNLIKPPNNVEAEDPETLVLKEQVLKELIDCVYVLVGTCVDFKWDFDEAFKRVHESNMSKLKGKIEKHEDGKIKKSKTYKPCDLLECL